MQDEDKKRDIEKELESTLLISEQEQNGYGEELPLTYPHQGNGNHSIPEKKIIVLNPDNFHRENANGQSCNMTNGQQKVTSHPISEIERLDLLIKSALITAGIEIPAPPVCLQIVSNGQSSDVATLGNLSMVIGKAKSRKTFCLSIAIASAIKNDIVIYFVTDQSNYHLHLSLNRILRLAGMDKQPTNLMSYGLRRFTPSKRLEMIDRTIETTPGVGLVVIDGIRDLVSSINDEQQATLISTKLMNWTDEKNIHIICVLHQNKNDNNARGHIGSELIAKAESVLSVTKDSKNDKVSIVEAEFCRGKEFAPFAFEINDNGLPIMVEQEQIEATQERRSKSPYDYDEEFHTAVLTEVFRNRNEFTYGDLWREIKLICSEQEINIGDNKAKDFIAYYIKEKKINKKGKIYCLPELV